MKYITLLLLGLVCVQAWGDQTIDFQYGVKPDGGYIEYSDTFTTALDPDTTYGAYKHLTVAGYGSPSHIFVNFNIKQKVSAGSTIKKATLYLYPKVYKKTPSDIYCYLVSTDWEARFTTWKVASPGVRWEVKGGEVDGDVKSKSMKIDEGYHTWDVTDIVQYWANYPSKNAGMMLRFDNEKTENEAWYYSCETQINEYRPRLEVTFITKEGLEKEKAEEAKRKEEEKNKRIQDILEGKNPNEPAGGGANAGGAENALEKAKKKLGKSYQIVELTNTPYRSYSQARPLKDWFGFKIRFTSRAPGVLGDVRNDKTSASIKGKFGKAYEAWWVTAVTKESTKLRIRIRSRVSFAIDLNQDNEYDPREELFKLNRDHVGPITFENVIADQLKIGYKYDYTGFIIKNPYRPRQEYENDSGLFVLRHGGYLEGKFGDKDIQIFDDNNDFKYDTSGEDTLVIDGEEYHLNTYTEIGGQLYKTAIEPGGAYVAFAPVSSLKTPPKMCSFDAFKEFNRGKTGLMPEYIILTCVDRDKNGLYTADRKNPVIQVPQGSYQIFFAALKSGRSRDPYVIDGGNMTAFSLNTENYTLKWGAPLSLQFMANRAGSSDEYKIGVNSIRIVDSCGAELRFPQNEKRFITAPKVEFYPGQSTRKESSKMFTLRDNSNQLSDMTAKVKKSGTYRIVMIAKTKLFGELKGEVSR